MTLDLVGKRYGRWLVQSRSKRTRSGQFWNCVCTCGTTREVLQGNLVRRRTTSCGCFRSEKARKHGDGATALYQVWVSMRHRCESPRATGYARYGGRGIKVDKRWLGPRGYLRFKADLGLPPFPGARLERVDNDGDYTPSNVRWASAREQARNRRSNRVLTWKGVSRCLAEWAETQGIPYKTLQRRLADGWSDAETLGTPVGGDRSHVV